MIGASSPQNRQVLVCQYRSCSQQGAAEVLNQFQALLPNGVSACGSECMGQCSTSVTVRILPDNTWYCNLKPDHVVQIVMEHLQGDRPVTELLHPRFHPAAYTHSHLSHPQLSEPSHEA